MAVHLLAADLSKTHPAVEPARACILLVDLKAPRSKNSRGMFDQGFANALAMAGGINEQRFDAPIVHDHEAQGAVSRICGERHGRNGKKARNLFPNRQPVFS